MRASFITDAPRAASVGASAAPITASTTHPVPRKSGSATANPAAIVKGSPMHKRRAAIRDGGRSNHLTLTLEASENRIKANASSTTVRSSSLPMLRVTKGCVPDPSSKPARANTMGAVTLHRPSRPETSTQPIVQARTIDTPVVTFDLRLLSRLPSGRKRIGRARRKGSTGGFPLQARGSTSRSPRRDSGYLATERAIAR